MNKTTTTKTRFNIKNLKNTTKNPVCLSKYLNIRYLINAIVMAIFILAFIPLALSYSDDAETASESSLLEVNLDANAAGGLDTEADSSAAEISNTDNSSVNISAETSANTESSAGTSRGQARGRLFIDTSRERIEERREIIRENREAIKKRAVEVRSDIKELRDKFNYDFKIARDEIKTHRLDLMEIKRELIKCKDENCSEIRSKFNLGLKLHLEKFLLQADRSFEQLKDRIETSGGLSAQDKETALARITTLEAAVASKKAEIGQLSANATREETKQAIKDMQKLVRDTRFEQRKLIALLISSKYEILIDKHLRIESSMQARIDELKERGANVSDLTALHEKFIAQSKLLEEKQQAAREHWLEAQTREDKLEAWHAAHTGIKEDLYNLRSILRDFMELYKDTQSHFSVDASAEDTTESNAREPDEQAAAST